MHEKLEFLGITPDDQENYNKYLAEKNNWSFGQETDTLVHAIQKARSLTANGVVDGETWGAINWLIQRKSEYDNGINKDYEAIRRSLVYNRELIINEKELNNVRNISLEKNSTNTGAVNILQRDLIKLGMDISATGLPDGGFGDKTELAVAIVQEAGLKPGSYERGRVDEATWKTIYDFINRKNYSNIIEQRDAAELIADLDEARDEVLAEIAAERAAEEAAREAAEEAAIANDPNYNAHRGQMIADLQRAELEKFYYEDFNYKLSDKPFVLEDYISNYIEKVSNKADKVNEWIDNELVREEVAYAKQKLNITEVNASNTQQIIDYIVTGQYIHDQALEYVIGLSGGVKITGITKGSIEASNLSSKIISRIKENSGLVRQAEAATKDESVQKETNDLIKKLLSGNTNAGIGSKNLFKDICYLRSDSGARVFYRIVSGRVEILAKSSKKNEAKVIKILQELYGK